MADVIGMWYREGRATLEKDSRQVEGLGTYWLTNCRPGDLFAVTDGGAAATMYEIESNPNDRGILLATAFRGESAQDVEYAIIRSFTAKWSVPGDLSYQMQDVIAQFTRAIQENFRGEKGEKGNDGRTIYGGSGAPVTTLGTEGDFYLDYAGQDMYHREAGGWIVRMNVRGIKGDDGRDGTIWYFGATPAAGFGNVGDFNFNHSSGDVHRRVATGWEPVGNFVGPKGDKGERGDKGDKGEKGEAARWHVGSGVPTSTLGKANDMYLDRSNGDAYQKSSAGAWTKESNIRGIQGEKGEPGIPGVNPKGAYSNTMEYAARDSVLHMGSTWVAKVASIGVSPPQVATTPETENWLLVAAKGHDGDGTGDMLRSVYDVDNDGMVDVAKHAETADTATQATTAGSVAWSGVQNVPEAAPDRTGIIRVATAEEVDGGVSAMTAVSPQQLRRVREATPATALTADQVNGLQEASLSAGNRVATMRDLQAVDASMYRDSGLVVLSAEDDSGTFIVEQNSTIVANILPLASKIKINGKNYVVEMVEPNPLEPGQTAVQVDLTTLSVADTGKTVFTAFQDGIVPEATAASPGIARRASDEEAEAGESEDGFVNPKQLKQFGGGVGDSGTFIATGLTVLAAEDGADSFEIAEILEVVEARVSVGTKIKVNGKVATITSLATGTNENTTVVFVDRTAIVAADVGAEVAKGAIFIPAATPDRLGLVFAHENAAASAVVSIVEFTKPGTHAWTVPEGVTEIIVSAAAGGGGGGGAGKHGAEGATTSGGGGGGAQAFCRRQHQVVPGDVMEIKVGSGGAGGTAGNINILGGYGGDGVATSITGMFSLAGGGGAKRGGLNNNSTWGTYVPGAAGGEGGTPSQPSNAYVPHTSNPYMVANGFLGGHSLLGTPGVGGMPRAAWANSQNGTDGYRGGGGGGGCADQFNTNGNGVIFGAGGKGGDGVVIIEYIVGGGSSSGKDALPLIPESDIGDFAMSELSQAYGLGVDVPRLMQIVDKTLSIDFADWRQPATPQVGGGWSNFQSQWQRDIRRVRRNALVDTKVSVLSGSYSGGNAHPYICGILLMDGRVYCVPHTATTARIFDPKTGAVSIPKGTFTVTQFAGGVLLPDGRVFLVPCLSTTARIYDPNTDTLITPNGAYPYSGNNLGLFYSGVLLSDGRVFCIPYNTTKAYIYNPVTDTVVEASETYSGNGAFANGVLLADGRVFMVPTNSTTARIYNPATDTLTTPSGTYPGNNAFFSAILLPDGRVFMVPRASTTARIYDPISDTLTTPPGTYPGSNNFSGGVLLPDGRVFMVPCNSTSARIYDPETCTLITPTGAYPGNAGSFCGVKLFDGRVFIVPCNTTAARMVDTVEFSAGAFFSTSPFFNKL